MQNVNLFEVSIYQLPFVIDTEGSNC